MPNIKRIWLLPLIMGLSLILSTVIAVSVYYVTRTSDDVLSVTGSTKVSVKSDLAKWTIDYSRVVSNISIKVGYEQMAKDLAVVKAYFKKQGIEESVLTVSPVFMDQSYDYNKPAAEREFTLRQTIALSLNDVEKMTTIAKNTKEIVDGGVIFSPRPVEYYYTNLPKLRVDLLSDAVKDAKDRAVKLTESTGRSVGPLRNASSGVVQVLPENSLEISDYGTYDTTTINKEVMMTVRVSFSIN